MTNWLSTGEPFDALISNNDEMAIGAIQAMKASGISMDDVVVGGIDATQDALLAMAAGELDVTVFQDAAGQGAGALDAALKLARGESVEQKVYVPFQLVTPENMSEFTAEELTARRSERGAVRAPPVASRPHRPDPRGGNRDGRNIAWRSAG